MPTDWSPAGPDQVIHGDNLDVIAALPDGAFTLVYLDPPYIDQGAKLYANGDIDHARLSRILRSAEGANWLISYDNSAQIDPLYGDWANVLGVDVLSHLHHKTITDVIITPRSHHGE